MSDILTEDEMRRYVARRDDDLAAAQVFESHEALRAERDSYNREYCDYLTEVDKIIAERDALRARVARLEAALREVVGVACRAGNPQIVALVQAALADDAKLDSGDMQTHCCDADAKEPGDG